MGFPYFEMEFSTRFPYSEMTLSAYFLHFPHYLQDFRGLEMGFPAFEMALFHFRLTEINFKTEEKM